MKSKKPKQPEPETLGSKIRELRLLRGLSLRQLAFDVGVSPAFISDLERDNRSTSRLGDFARVLGVSEDSLAILDNRVNPDLARWFAATPSLIPALRKCQQDGISGQEVLDALYGLLHKGIRK